MTVGAFVCQQKCGEDFGFGLDISLDREVVRGRFLLEAVHMYFGFHNSIVTKRYGIKYLILKD